MNIKTLHAQRGQLLPLWSMALVTSFALIFFIQNYADQIRWTIRAQNAADSAASGGLLPDADLANQATTTLYALALDEVRIRYLNQAAIDILSGYGCSGSANCAQDYNAIYQALSNAVSVYNPGASGVNLPKLENKQNATNGAENNGYKLTAQGCSNTPQVGDCTNGSPTFNYYTLNSSSGQIDVYACKQISTSLPQLLGLSSTSSFKAIARSTLGLVAHAETFTPATALNPNNSNQPYAPNEYASGVADQNSYTQTNFSSFNVTAYYYTPGMVAPSTSFNPNNLQC